jgi:hypothetical protein
MPKHRNKSDVAAHREHALVALRNFNNLPRLSECHLPVLIFESPDGFDCSFARCLFPNVANLPGFHLVFSSNVD